VIVFTRTKHGADRVAKNLVHDGFDAEAIHGNKSQNNRQRALQGFRDGRVRVLVATDIAARGIDVPGVTHVVNYELPDEPETYVHRIGRTARNGAAGAAITLCADEERGKLAAVERLIRLRLLPEGARAAGATPKKQPKGKPQAGRAGAAKQAKSKPQPDRAGASKQASRQRRRWRGNRKAKPASVPA
jgi:ATP-dependent RNA helicase RhlE